MSDAKRMELLPDVGWDVLAKRGSAIGWVLMGVVEVKWAEQINGWVK